MRCRRLFDPVVPRRRWPFRSLDDFPARFEEPSLAKLELQQDQGIAMDDLEAFAFGE